MTKQRMHKLVTREKQRPTSRFCQTHEQCLPPIAQKHFFVSVYRSTEEPRIFPKHFDQVQTSRESLDIVVSIVT
jgi:hypothetical protein